MWVGVGGGSGVGGRGGKDGKRRWCGLKRAEECSDGKEMRGDLME